MLTKIKNYIKLVIANSIKNVELNNEILKLSKELEWAHIYHDSIRGKEELEKLPLNVGRWAGNYSFFYVLNRILSDYKPNKILDLGLGESSKFITTYLDNYLKNSKHTIVEQDTLWIDSFQNRFKLSDRSNIVHCPIEEIDVKGFKSNSYQNFSAKITDKYDLYVVDGPFGSDRFSRYNITSLVEKFTMNEEFIILMDDTNRIGEMDTVKDIINILKTKNITHYLGNFIGNKGVTLIVSDKYKFVTSV